MSVCLLTKKALPFGIPYFNLHAVPKVLNDTGGLINFYDFTSSTKDIIGNGLFVGDVVKQQDGVFLSKTAFVDTKNIETEEFTWVALVRTADVLSTLSPVISSFLRETMTADGFSAGVHLALTSTNLQKTAGTNVVTVFGAANIIPNQWVLIAISRVKSGSGYVYNYAVKPQGSVLQENTSGIYTKGINTETTVKIGWLTGFDTLGTSPQLFNFAGINNKPSDQTQLKKIMEDLTNYSSKRGIVL